MHTAVITGQTREQVAAIQARRRSNAAGPHPLPKVARRGSRNDQVRAAIRESRGW